MRSLACLLIVAALCACSGDPDENLAGSYRGSLTWTPSASAAIVDTDVLANINRETNYSVSITSNSGSCLLNGARRQGDTVQFNSPESCTFRAAVYDLRTATGALVSDQLTIDLTGEAAAAQTIGIRFVGSLEAGTR
jgi:hypothetical protein